VQPVPPTRQARYGNSALQVHRSRCRAVLPRHAAVAAIAPVQSRRSPIPRSRSPCISVNSSTAQAVHQATSNVDRPAAEKRTAALSAARRRAMRENTDMPPRDGQRNKTPTVLNSIQRSRGSTERTNHVPMSSTPPLRSSPYDQLSTRYIRTTPRVAIETAFERRL